VLPIVDNRWASRWDRNQDQTLAGIRAELSISRPSETLQLFLKAAFRCSSSYGGRSPLSFQVDWLSEGPIARRVPYCKTHPLDVASTKGNAELMMAES